MRESRSALVTLVLSLVFIVYLCEHVPQSTWRRGLDPAEMRVVVAGGSGGGGFATQRVTMKIDLPRNWSQLVKKCRDIVP
jgi:hypothetical protein